MKKWLNYLPTLFIITIVISLIAYSSTGNSVRMNYTEFQKLPAGTDFQDSQMTISSTVINVEGTYKNGDKTVNYSVLVPNTDENMAWLQERLTSDGGQITVEDPSTNGMWLSLLGQLIPFLLVGVFFYYMFTKMGGAGGSNKAFEFSKSKARVESNVKTRFKDVAGCEEEKEEVKEIIEYLRSPKIGRAHV